VFTLDQQHASPVLAENLYHFGYLVPDLREAMAWMSRTLGIAWAAPFEAAPRLESPDGVVDVPELRIAYSEHGPPFIELIETVESEPTSVFAEAFGAHHLGVYAERWRDETHRLVGMGCIHEANGSGMSFVRDPVLGVRYEIVSFGGRPFLTNVLDGSIGAQRPLRERR
jgi:hypothetical protein